MAALVALETARLTTTASSITFNNGGAGIPQGYKALHIRGTAEGNSGSTTIIQIQFGGLTGNIVGRYFTSGAAFSNDGLTVQNQGRLGECPGVGGTDFGVFRADIFGYNSLIQSISCRSTFSNWTGGSGTRKQGFMITEREAHTSVITSIVISPSAGSFIAGTTVSLYGWV